VIPRSPTVVARAEEEVKHRPVTTTRAR
jgi:hypothetical protein